MASIFATTASGPVKIRNLSPQGALIESSVLPAVGETLELKRGPLFASGRVVWREANKAGLRFDGSIDVGGWLPAAHCAQQAVDTIVQQAKAAAAGHSTVRAEYTGEGNPIDGDQLRRLARALDLLADDLADDASVVIRHAQKLQALDSAAQMLRKVAAVSERRCISSNVREPLRG